MGVLVLELVGWEFDGILKQDTGHVGYWRLLGGALVQAKDGCRRAGFQAAWQKLQFMLFVWLKFLVLQSILSVTSVHLCR